MPAGGKPKMQITVTLPYYEALVNEFRKLPKSTGAKYMASALRDSIKPGTRELRRLTPKGPTGNLKNAIAVKVVKYTKQDHAWAVALTGYTRAGKGESRSAQGGKVRKGKDRAFHQGFIEFGTKDRYTRSSSIASSYRTLGPFQLGFKEVRRKGSDGKYSKVEKDMRQAAKRTGKIYTVPKYPKAFFKRAPHGELVKLGRTKKGGKKGLAPVKTAFILALPAMRSKLQASMTQKLQNAWRALNYRRATG